MTRRPPHTDPSIIAGTFLSQENNTDLAVNISRGLEGDGSGNIRVDEDTDFTFTADIDLSGGASMGGDLDLAGQSLTDTTQNYLDLTGDGNDLRLATGGAIEDGGGQSRLLIDSNGTKLEDDGGRRIIEGYNTNSVILNSYANQPLVVFDREGSFTAVQYDTAASAPGTLTFDADTYINDGGGLVVGDTARASVANGKPRIQFHGTSTNRDDRAMFGDWTNDSSAFAFTFAKSRSGTIGSPGTAVQQGDDLGVVRFYGDDGTDLAGGGAGFLKSVVDGSVSSGVVPGRIEMHTATTSGDNREALRIDSNQLVEVRNGDLRLATGQAIEDGSGTTRLEIASGRTQLSSEAGATNETPFLRLEEGQNMYQINTGGTVEISDDLGGFNAVKYIASASPPGTLELTNANFQFEDITHNLSWPDENGDGNSPEFFISSGEVIAQDDSGNTTTLT